MAEPLNLSGETLEVIFRLERRVEDKIDKILNMVRALARKEAAEMALTQDEITRIQKIESVQDAAAAAMTLLIEKVKDANSAGDPAAVDAALTELEGHVQPLSDAIANVPQS